MVVLRFIWKFLSVATAFQYFYWALMFAGAWLNLTAAPIVSLDLTALAFFGAGMLMIEIAFPSFAKASLSGKP